jgi:hypothetical protein
MESTQNKYPVFEANQVLTRGHLNNLVNYLDEQDRITRTNLIGIGITCGLDITFDEKKMTILVSKGAGVTSKGYLVVVPEEGLTLVSYRADYKIPDPGEYQEFIDPSHKNQYPLWELFPAGEPNTELLEKLDLTGKVVLLLFELKKESLRNCSPNNCDDKGSEVTTLVKPLLIEKANLDKIIKVVNSLSDNLTSGDPETTLLQRLDLPDIRLPRFDVSNTAPVTSNDIFEGFLKVFHVNLVRNTAKALSAAYEAFLPLLKEIYQDDPFKETFMKKFGFLERSPTTNEQVYFLQYYYDFFDDLLQAYDEFRWKGVGLVCACCPPEGVFPHHLMLGSLSPIKPKENIYRQNFIASPAISACAERSREVVQLFMRLVEMIRRFTDTPEERGTRITPTFGDGALSDKAIPYYYQQDGKPPLYQLWSYEKTMRDRAHLNLSYRYSEYENQPLPDFVSNPLSYDLEPHNFLRIEGHLGKGYQEVMTTLLSKISANRLPIDVLALRSGNSETLYSSKADQSSLHTFLKSHPGIQHKAGVPFGGTFLLVYSDTSSSYPNGLTVQAETVIADFYLPYQIAVRDIVSSIHVKECEYKWIDSIKHLNYISLRDYRPEKTTKAPAAHEHESVRLKDNYIIRIYKYDIQNHSLLSGNNPVDVVIPIHGALSIKTHKLAAVARKLNAQFPLGVVFDHVAGTDKLVVRSIDGQKYRIELGGIQGNQIRYAYENGVIYRWQNNLWEVIDGLSERGLLCRTAGSRYNEKEYQWLHQNFLPVLLDPVPAPAVKDVIAWEKMTLNRAKENSAADKLPIYKSVLVDIVSAIRRIDQNAKVILIGSWANGSWVSRSYRENIRSFREDKSTLRKFLDLRQKVAGKTGYSNIHLLVESEEQITSDMINVTTGYSITIIRGRKDAQKGLLLE